MSLNDRMNLISDDAFASLSENASFIDETTPYLPTLDDLQYRNYLNPTSNHVVEYNQGMFNFETKFVELMDRVNNNHQL